MADKKISQLTSATTPLVGTEVMPIVQSGATVKTSVSNVITASAGYTPDGTGAVARSVASKLQESVSVKDFGAVGDGVTDDTAAIQAAIDTGFPVFIPSGTYKTSGSLIIKGTITGAGQNQTVIQPTAQTFAAFTSSGVNKFKYKISGLVISYASATGGIAATNAAACGFNYTGTVAGTWDAEFTIEDVWIINAYTGFNDASLAYMYELKNVRVDNAKNGFIKSAQGTTIFLNRCYANGCSVSAFSFFGVNQLKLLNCAVDNCVTSVTPLYFATCYGVSIIGLDFESNTFTMNYSGVVTFAGCNGFLIDGMRGYLNTYTIGANEGYIIFVNGGSVGTIKNVTLGTADETATVTGTGATYPISIKDTSQVFIESSTVKRLTGGSVTARGIACGEYAGDVCTCVIEANVVLDVQPYTVATAARLINRSIADMSADNGDTSITIVPGVSNPVQLFNSPLTNNRTVTFVYNEFAGAKFRVVRTSNATGAFNLTVNGGKILNVGQWVDYEHNGAIWFVTGFGSL